MNVHMKAGHIGPVPPSSSRLGIRVGLVGKQVKHDTPLATLTHVYEGWLYKSIVYGRVFLVSRIVCRWTPVPDLEQQMRSHRNSEAAHARIKKPYAKVAIFTFCARCSNKLIRDDNFSNPVSAETVG